MGRGDKRTFRGKIYAGSYGNSRPQRARKKAAGKAPGASPAKAPGGR